MIVCIIPAKGDSNRLPNKNMALVAGRPMIDWTVDQAHSCKRLSAIYVSTDSAAIAAHANKLGVPVIMRQTSLGGETPIIDVYRHALAAMPEGDKVTVVVGLQVDHPDRRVSVTESLDIFEKEQCDRLMSKQADGTKNGAHYVLSRHYLDLGVSRKDHVIIDDCTNIHFSVDLENASRNLATVGR